MSRTTRRFALFALVLGALPAAAATDLEGELGVGLGLGYDSNPLRIMDDGSGGAFSELRFDGRLDLRTSRALKLFGTLEGQARAHGSDVSNADARDGELRLGAELAPNPQGHRPLVLAIGGSLGANRATFTDRSTGAPYAVAVGDGTTTAEIPERFDADTAGAFLDVRWRVQRRTRLWLKTALERTDFVNDYREFPELGSLDYRGLSLEPGVLVQVNRLAAVGLSALVTDLDYVEQTALDADGAPVAGTRRQYRSLDWALSLRIVPQRGMNLRVGLRDGDREDTFAGFYDYSARGAYCSFDWAPGPKGKLALLASLRRVDYSHATVPGTTSGETLGSDTRRLVGRYDWQAPSGLGFYAEAGLQRSDNQDPLFTYGRNWMLTGIQYRRRSAHD
ncbi:MAG TPA: hypothetical protein VJS92_12010 [Candidatus Polarisedimenticolaceae bacterium]|nr:hypothetical protein [Candidatus Polarisedimenticolaceae bacterium]